MHPMVEPRTRQSLETRAWIIPYLAHVIHPGAVFEYPAKPMTHHRAVRQMGLVRHKPRRQPRTTSVSNEAVPRLILFYRENVLRTIDPVITVPRDRNASVSPTIHKISECKPRDTIRAFDSTAPSPPIVGEPLPERLRDRARFPVRGVVSPLSE